MISKSFAAKFLNVAKNGHELAQVENFDLQIVRDGKPMAIGYSEDEDGEKTPKTKYSQSNIHFSKLNNKVRRVNELTLG